VVGEHKNQNVNLDKILMEISGQTPPDTKNWNVHAD